MDVTRRQTLGGGLAGAAALVIGGLGPLATSASAAAQPAAGATSGEPFLVGCGASDMTGAVAGQGMMGYSETDQVAIGLRQRYFARAFVIVDRSTGSRFLYVLGDIAELFDSVYVEALKRIKKKHGSLYSEQNTMMTCTHNHNSCGGTSHDWAYTLASYGFKKNSFEAEVQGIVEAVEMAHSRLAPGTILVGQSRLHNASANRSRVAFDLNPQRDKDYYPNAIDPRVTALKFVQGGREVGVLSWFATHGTSLTDRNRYISPDNKGIASYRWEHDEKGWRYLDGPPDFVAGFAQSSPGDMTPNLWNRKLDPSGPTHDNPANAAIIAERQYQAVKAAYDSATPLLGSSVKSVLRYIDMAHQQIDGRWTPDGKPGITTPTIMGAGAAATAEEENAYQPAPFLWEGMKDPLARFWGVDIDNLPTIPQEYLAAQAPKVNLLPLGFLPPQPWNPQIVPIQLTQLGHIVIVAGPVEFTIVAALRVRRLISAELGVDLENVICQSYANSYVQYCTTPEEYMSQQYEGGETQFGRLMLCAFLQNYHELCQVFTGKRSALDPRLRSVDKSGLQPDFLPPVPPDAPLPGKKFGDVITQPKPRYRVPETVVVEFSGAHPNNNLRRNDRYHEIQRKENGRWVRIADDNTYETTMHWERPAGSTNQSVIRIMWALTRSGATAGTYRVVHLGDWKDTRGGIHTYQGISNAFTIG